MNQLGYGVCWGKMVAMGARDWLPCDDANYLAGRSTGDFKLNQFFCLYY